MVKHRENVTVIIIVALESSHGRDKERRGDEMREEEKCAELMGEMR
jgi:hypothetical protein